MLERLFRRKAGGVLGVDIGTSTIKIIELSSLDHEKELTNYGVLNTYGYLARFNNAIQTRTFRMLDSEVASIVRDVVEEARVGTVPAVMSIPLFSSFFTLVEFPAMPKREIMRALPLEARKYIPIPLSEVSLDWEIVNANEKHAEKVSVILVAVPKDITSKYVRIAKMAGLTLVALEVEIFSLIRSLAPIGSRPTVIVDIGSRSTSVCIVEYGYVRMNHSFDASGDDLTRVISHSLNVNLERAEAIKKDEGITSRGGEPGISEIMIPILDLISSEVDRLMRSYEEKYGKRVDKLILAGGTAGMPGLIEYFVGKFGIECSRADPFSGVHFPSVLKPTLVELAPSFSVGIGLALRRV